MLKEKTFFCSIGLMICLGIVLSGCKQDKPYSGTDATLSFSSNLITFDTVFTSVSTITQTLIVRNPYNRPVETDIALGEGNNSYFSININGVATSQLQGVKIAAKDSIFIFIKALINPNQTNTPMLVCDTLTFITNGNHQHIPLVACGEDANFILPDRFLPVLNGKDTIYLPYSIIAAENDITAQWNSQKPYIIYGLAVIDENAKLTIAPGVRIYCHNQSGIWVYKNAAIDVQGTKEQPVTFQSDRRESWFAKTVGQWAGISINPSNQTSQINYAVIKHAREAIGMGTLDSTPNANKLVLSNTIIEYAGVGLRALKSNVEAFNNVFANCQSYCIYAAMGGNYQFVNNTIYNVFYGNTPRTTPSVYLANYWNVNSGGYLTTYVGDFDCRFYNNIIWGSQENVELLCDKNSHATFVLDVQNSLLKMKSEHLSFFTTNQDNILNQNPRLKDPGNEDFSLNQSSPCIGKGKQDPITPLLDIEGKSRKNPPDIGAYEY